MAPSLASSRAARATAIYMAISARRFGRRRSAWGRRISPRRFLSARGTTAMRIVDPE
jgi:hypothetical protein